ncbi:dTDP-4-amino-4,6-dideoxygalactose transaminase [Desulfotignum balticum]|jgi:dTDP-4-amino-4,6-dideoxygalactose transaminase|uniref:dTDP-4-amino-4,6-dideoxygalactose transaminase n=1 Tax=Desulfotignum balticum TaxID=115781 RepID=UPI00040DC319|nr:dTDP-4-amino-4,6-dideoxygalactose transaminase [Desulfotignum balticum]
MPIRFNIPPRAGRELEYIKEAINTGRLAGNGAFTKRCHAVLQMMIGAGKVLLTPSCTDALEMAAILAEVGPGDEVIMPSFTFVSTANAFVLRGATPVFVDIEAETLNINPEQVASAVTSKTKAIVPVHYAGVGCNMDSLKRIAKKSGLLLIEDAAQGVMSEINGSPLGSMGDLAALSFHETKNIVSGEGGALLINNPGLFERAEIIWEKGTNRSKFIRGEVDKYTWVDVGSSYLPSELQAAFLLAQLESAEEITGQRMAAWQRYRQNLLPLEQAGRLRLPVIPQGYKHNAHMFYILLNSAKEQAIVLEGMKKAEINAVFHYQPLHSAPAGRLYGRAHGALKVTDDFSARLVRLPVFAELTAEQVDHICSVLDQVISG